MKVSSVAILLAAFVLLANPALHAVQGQTANPKDQSSAANNLGSDRNKDEATEKPTEKTTENPIKTTTEKPTEKEKTTEKRTEQEKTTEKRTEQEKTTGKPSITPRNDQSDSKEGATEKQTRRTTTKAPSIKSQIQGAFSAAKDKVDGTTKPKPPPVSVADLSAADKLCAQRCKGANAASVANFKACLMKCDSGGDYLKVVRAANTDRIPGYDGLKATVADRDAKAVAEKARPTDPFVEGLAECEKATFGSTLGKEGCKKDAKAAGKTTIDDKYAKGAVKNPYSGAVVAAKPAVNEKFKMSKYEGGGLRRDGSAPDKTGKYANAVRNAPPTSSVKVVFDSMVNANCDNDSNGDDICFFKCMQNFKIGHDGKSLKAADNGADMFTAGSPLRIVPFDFPDCECAEGSGDYGGTGKPTYLTFKEATGERVMKATFDGEKTITMAFTTLEVMTDIKCVATYKVYNPAQPKPITKKYADGNEVSLDYGSLKEATELRKQMGAKIAEKGTAEKTELDGERTSTFQTVFKKTLLKELKKEHGDRRHRRQQGRGKGSRKLSDLGVTADTTVTELVTAIPEAYDTREAYPRCTPAVRTQGTCGSCWTFATTGVLTQRTCIANEGLTADFVLSPQALVTCDDDCYASEPDVCNDGCTGGYTSLAFDNMVEFGSTLENCVEYTSAGGSDLEICGDQSVAGSVVDKWRNCELESEASDNTIKGSDSYSVNGEEEMMADIYMNGPIQATFLLESDMYGYKSGIYECETDAADLGGHATIIVGWGIEAGVKYWIVQNSWGSDWGDEGFFKMRRGVNSCEIESYADAVTASASTVTFEETAPDMQDGNTDNTDNTNNSDNSGSARLAGAAAAAVFGVAVATLF